VPSWHGDLSQKAGKKKVEIIMEIKGINNNSQKKGCMF
jgi:hypothetical protein